MRQEESRPGEAWPGACERERGRDAGGGHWNGGHRVFWRTSTSIRWLCPLPSLLAVSTGLSSPLVLAKMPLGSSRHSRHVLLSLLLPFLSCLPAVHAQAISTSMPVPPLQWIELTSLLGGSAAPPLKDATIGYDNTNRIILIFGGESQQGFPTRATYACVSSRYRCTSAYVLRNQPVKFGPEDAPVVHSYCPLRPRPGAFSQDGDDRWR